MDNNGQLSKNDKKDRNTHSMRERERERQEQATTKDDADDAEP